jgi:hypothetical protein
MTGIIVTLLIIAVAAAAAGGAAIAIGAQRVKQNTQRGQQISPGTPSAVPLGWAGAHTPEAKLHRRLGQAMSGLRAATEDDVLVMANVEVVEREALKIEQQLVGASRMADRLKGPTIAQLGAAVDQIENVSAQLIQRSSELSAGDVQTQLAELSERLELLDQARAELDQGPTPGTAADDQ